MLFGISPIETLVEPPWQFFHLLKGEDGQARMVRMVGNLLQSIEQNALTLKENEGGTYTTIKDQTWKNMTLKDLKKR